MILVFFLGVIVLILITTLILIIFSHIQLEINNFEISSKMNSNCKYEVTFSLYFANRIKWSTVHLDSLKMKKIYTKMHFEKIDIHKLEKDIKFSDIKEIIKIRPNIKKLKLKIDIGLENIVLTSYLIPLICTVLSVIFSKNVCEKDLDEIEYLVNPIYNEGNKYHIKLSGILNISILRILKSAIKIYKRKKFSNKEITNKANCSV